MISFPFSRFTVQGNSMLPRLKPGTSIISFNWSYLFSKPQKGDLVVLKVKGKNLVKRISKFHNREDLKIFVTGDNKKESTDSRSFGWVNKKQILGKVVMVFES